MKYRSHIIVIIFAVMLAIIPIISMALPNQEISIVERRPLAQWMSYRQYKETNYDATLSKYFSSLEEYLLDQFPLRDDFRKISALSRKYLFRQFDQDRYFKANGHLGKLDPVLHRKTVARTINLFNDIYHAHFLDGKGRHLFALIPDKIEYMDPDKNYPHVCVDQIAELLDASLPERLNILSLKQALSLDRYYRTDPHWNQTFLLPVADHLLRELGNSTRASDLTFETRSLGLFLGTYGGQAALPIKADELQYLDCDEICHATVYDWMSEEMTDVYQLDKREAMDPYDIFLGGARPLLKVTNEKAKNDRKLVVFRDSFGSSLVPLFIPAYSEILVVDLRYVRADLIKDELTTYQNADVLFLYSTTVLNSPGAFPVQ